MLLQITVSPVMEIWRVILPHEFQCAAGRLRSVEIGSRVRPNCPTSNNLLIYVVQWNRNDICSVLKFSCGTHFIYFFKQLIDCV